MSKASNIKPLVRVSFYNPDSELHSVMGHGVAELLEGVKELGSLRKAAMKMGMAYSKAWRIISKTGDAFGFDLIISKVPKGSALSKEAEILLSAYNEMTEELQQKSEELFEEKISSLLS